VCDFSRRPLPSIPIILLPHPPRRIISLVPSQTELLYALGLDEEVVGITKFCVHPPAWHRHKTRVGGTKDIHSDIIRSLQPDLIIANKEENLQQQVEALFPHYPVWVSDVASMPDALEMIIAVGALTGTEEKANIFHDLNRYPSIELSALVEKKCQLVLLSSELYPFRDKHIAEINAVLPSATIKLVDGEMFSWYGSRLLESSGYFRAWLRDL
jgi:hypothetical protein